MTNRAQVTTPYTVDIFFTLQPGEKVTFSEHPILTTIYKVTPDSTNQEIIIPVSTFNQFFKFYKQGNLFAA